MTLDFLNVRIKSGGISLAVRLVEEQYMPPVLSVICP